jgi:hypothetical protein
MTALVGYVKKVNTKTGSGKRGPWTLYSGILELDNGTESGWISFGFERPPFNEGSYISIETQETERGLDYVAGSGKVLPPPSKPAASVPAAGSTAAPAKQSGYVGTASKPSGFVDRNDSIVYQSSRKDAIALIALLLEHDALPMSASTAKAGQSKRFEEIQAYADKLTVQFFHDVGSLRLLQSVVDAGAESDGADASGDAGIGAGRVEDND